MNIQTNPTASRQTAFAIKHHVRVFFIDLAHAAKDAVWKRNVALRSANRARAAKDARWLSSAKADLAYANSYAGEVRRLQRLSVEG